MRDCLPAAGGGSRPRHRDRHPDAAALPGLPLLHGGVPVPCALLQLVGSRVARRHGKDAESGRRRRACAAWWRNAISATGACTRPKTKAAAAGKREIDPGGLCARVRGSLSHGGDRFGDLADRTSAIAQASRIRAHAFRLLEKLGTEPKIYYRSNRPWVRDLAAPELGRKTEVQHG